MEKNIAEFVASAQKGNDQAFEWIFEATKNAVYYTCLGLMRNEADAKDLMQETFITSFQKITSLTEPDKYLAWVHRIAVNKCKDVLVARKAWIISTDEVENIEDIPDTDLESLPESYIIQKDKRDGLLQIMRDRLSEVQYRAILLFYFDELSIAEIASLMKCSENTVKSRLHLAKAKLKEGITMYEKENKDKLYPVIPFLARFFRADARETLVPTVTVNLHENAANAGNHMKGDHSSNLSQRANSAADAANQSATAKDASLGKAASGIFASSGSKIAVAILCTVLIISGIAVGIKSMRNHDQDTQSLAKQTDQSNVAADENNLPETKTAQDSAAAESNTDDENTQEQPEFGIYENDVLELCYDPENVDFTILDIAQTEIGLTVLTSDNIVGGITYYDGTVISAQQVSENSTGLMSTDQFLVSNEDGTFSLYPIEYGTEDTVASPDTVIREGIDVANLCYADISTDDKPMILYLDGTTLMYTNFGDTQDVPIYFSKENEDTAFYPVRGIYYCDSSFFVLLENNEVYDLDSYAFASFTVSKEPSPDPDAAEGEMVNTLPIFNIPRITDVANIYAVGSLNWYNREVIYEKIGDSENIYAYNFLAEEECFSTKLPDGYTTADIAHVETGSPGIMIEFSDGHIYLMDANNLSQLTYSEELTDLNNNGKILKIIGGIELFLLMDDHQLYDVDF